ncbi:hypothetical protein PVBG_03682 [Plasmodium vivax Brazil I]|uniref:Variable surface protein n=1 Tax=Plasmodium vivax (strain Brazil I) TaxID=1033975 RepID=A0A0J9T3Z7_PLAV1|nr:hypothetical protein PVBG_03682 [Plasmodium vivax Brazil I]
MDNQYNHRQMLNIIFNRLLAKQELKKDLYKTKLGRKNSNYGMNKYMNNAEEDLSAYLQTKTISSNELERYKKRYNHRYSKKKGLAKLDCYMENIVFNKIEYIYKLAENLKNNKKLFKKNIYNMYGYVLLRLTLIPALGLIIPVFFGEYSPIVKKWCFSTCDGTIHTDSSIKSEEEHAAKGFYKTSISESSWKIIEVMNMVIFLSIIFVALIIIFYTLIKVVKYERLKAGKGKIKGKEYYRFCKEVFGITNILNTVI